MQGEVKAEVAKILKKYGISAFEVKGHGKEDEIKKALNDAIEKKLSYENELHPLNPYLKTSDLKKDEFIQRLIDEIFTPHKREILNAVGEREFMDILRDRTQRHYRNLEEKSAQYILSDFKTTDDKHRTAVAKYLTNAGIKASEKDVGLRPDKHLSDLYRLALTKYS